MDSLNGQDWRVICGDCLEVMPEAVSDRSVNLVLCDLPYQVTSLEWDVMIPLSPLWAEYRRVLKTTGAVLLTATQPFTSELVMSNRKWFKYELIWDKVQTGAPGVAKMRPLPCHESVLVFAPGPTVYHPQMSEGSPYQVTSTSAGNKHGFGFKGNLHLTVNEGNRYPLSIIQFPRDRTVFHATQKPVDLLDYLIRTYSNEGDLVLDNTCGSGSTGIATRRTGRRFIGIEKDAESAQIAEGRISNAYSDTKRPSPRAKEQISMWG